MGLNPFSRDKSVCKGKYGMVENEDGERIQGIEMKCPDHNSDRVVVTGNKEEAQTKARSFLEENNYSAKIRDDS